MNLDTLVAPLGADGFLRDHWPSRPYFSADGDGRLAALAEIPELQSVETTITGSKRVNFFAPDGAIVDAEHPLKLYRLGLTCSMSCTHVPGFMQIAEQFAFGLGVASGSLSLNDADLEDLALELIADDGLRPADGGNGDR
jgi:hypothetical protein